VREIATDGHLGPFMKFYRIRLSDLFLYLTWIALLVFLGSSPWYVLFGLSNSHPLLFKLAFWILLYSARYYLAEKTGSETLKFFNLFFAMPLLLFVYWKIADWDIPVGSYIGYPAWFESPLSLFAVPLISMRVFEWHSRHFTLGPYFVRALCEILIFYPCWCLVIKLPIMVYLSA
jgi:hypothetical protein